MMSDPVAALLNHVWQSTLFAAGVWLLTRVLTANAASLRYRLWLAASLKFLLPFSWLIDVGRAIGWRSAPATTATTWSVAIEPLFVPGTMASAMPAAAPFDLRLSVFVVWSVGVVFVLLSWWRAYRPVRAALCAARPLQMPDLALPAHVRAMSSRVLLEPGVVGIFRPVLLLPEGLHQRLSPAQLQAVLAHELCHVRRRDNLAAVTHMVVEALYWFHPAVWWIERRLVEERERACDEAVLDAGVDPSTYAEGILRVCRSYIESRVICAPGVSGANLRQRIEAIMNSERATSLPIRKKIIIAAATAATIAGPVVVGWAGAPTVRAQVAEGVVFDAKGPAFDVTSVRLNTSGEPMPGGDVFSRNGMWRAANMTVRQMIVQASRLQGRQIVGGPKWIDEEHFDVVGKTSTSFEFGVRPAAGMFEMVRTLLADRFKLSAHSELREMPVYALVFARGDSRWGPRLRKAAVDCRTIDFSRPNPQLPYGFCGGIKYAPGHFIGQGATLAQLAKNLTPFGRIVLDRTGVAEPVDLDVEWQPAGPRGSTVDLRPADPGSGDGASVFAALQEQLGLKLEPTKAMIDVLVIDRVERPTPD